ncbi:MAG: IS982 family transposase [Chlamydiota bacterium]
MAWDEQLIALFCSVDNFCKDFEPIWRKSLLSFKKRKRNSQMFLSEMMTIAIYFHQSGYRTFKKFYTVFVKGFIKHLFPNAVSYGRFVELMKGLSFPFFCFLQLKMGKDTGVSFIDSTRLAVCKIQRANANKTFSGIATKGKTTMGWFFGFKLHIVINDEGELLAWQLTKGNVDDRKPVPALSNILEGLLFGDKGYISGQN